MNENKTNAEIVKLPNGKELTVDPMLLIESIDDVNAIAKAHIQILSSVKSIIQRAVAAGLKPEEAAGLALTLQQRAQQKANSKVHMDVEEMDQSDTETAKGTEEMDQNDAEPAKNVEEPNLTGATCG